MVQLSTITKSSKFAHQFKDQILLHAQQVAMANRPSDRDYTSVENFIYNTSPLVEADAQFIYNKDDLVTLRPGRESAWLDAFIEKFLKLFPRQPVQRLFCSRVIINT
jgi:hypothetical protein